MTVLKTTPRLGRGVIQFAHLPKVRFLTVAEIIRPSEKLAPGPYFRAGPARLWFS